ncbi:hypothetical protein Pmani_010144 [Petrolisthes manimaculis]|uniref:Uncharacterized protein n=1 Tax=Petrolisthes manimaculis TaxID=1843537 RepID=A0AAE1Q3P1_9EUCA|nr:hypothetical protein Pmani_010144 [Petrolisthes manimaculis]
MTPTKKTPYHSFHDHLLPFFPRPPTTITYHQQPHQNDPLPLIPRPPPTINNHTKMTYQSFTSCHSFHDHLLPSTTTPNTIPFTITTTPLPSPFIPPRRPPNNTTTTAPTRFFSTLTSHSHHHHHD